MNTHYFTHFYLIKRYGTLCFILLSMSFSLSAATEFDEFEAAPSIISEYRIGILAHGVGPIDSRKENGVDLNLEVLFNSPQFFSNIASPRPSIGTSINTQGYTSFIHSGLMWDFDITESFFTSLGLGIAVHDGNNGSTTDSKGRITLGCWWLFHESLEFGLRIKTNFAVSVFWEHFSHGDICSERNSGMDNSGLRLHYKF